MLTLTENAVMAIRDLTAQGGALPSGGLRISSGPSAGSVTLEVAQQPAQGDHVVDNLGARLFLDAEAAELLDDQALDAAVDEQGGVQFAFADRPH
jgi:Fe-S cluster assembly iron-binding protein IscA